MATSRERNWREDQDRSVIHAPAAPALAGNDYTLCGVALDGESGDEPMEATDDKLSCPECISIIRHCKTFRERDMRS